ncbi:hypothetical protein MMC30_007663 [Trapelia coarctata]|nr:hypothetical protein [Trapelia coarctata]
MSRHRFDEEEFDVSGERPWVAQAVRAPQFHVDDDQIYIKATAGARRGPYKIASVDASVTPVRYTLCSADGAMVDDGVVFEETRLEQRT